MKDDVLREDGTRPLVPASTNEKIMASAERGIDHATHAWRILQMRGLEPYGTTKGEWPPVVDEKYRETLGYQVAELIRSLWEIHGLLSPTPPDEETLEERGERPWADLNSEPD